MDNTQKSVKLMIDEEKINMGIFQKSFRLLKHSNLSFQDFSKPICIIGMPGIADVGKFAVDQLIGILNAKKFCDIISYNYPAGAIIDDSILSTPKAEMLFYKDKKGERDIILITADAQAMTPNGIYEVSDLIAELLDKLKITEIISLGAFPGNYKDDIRIYLTSTENFDIRNYPGCSRMSKGVIIGSNGLIPTLAKARFKIPGKVFLAEIKNQNSMNDGITDLKASVLLLDKVASIYNLPIEPVFSDKKVSELSKDLEQKRKKLEKELDACQPIEKIVEQEKTLYI
ncbi:MAG: hypothetical protein GF364_01800 [Candidatus Lokiarchaeota archaeon]|nr:hypothetical protein [Candidatus Lokiarchaeota archaeon]